MSVGVFAEELNAAFCSVWLLRCALSGSSMCNNFPKCWEEQCVCAVCHAVPCQLLQRDQTQRRYINAFFKQQTTHPVRLFQSDTHTAYSGRSRDT